jgi:hypothetical protein
LLFSHSTAEGISVAQVVAASSDTWCHASAAVLLLNWSNSRDSWSGSFSLKTTTDEPPLFSIKLAN